MQNIFWRTPLVGWLFLISNVYAISNAGAVEPARAPDSRPISSPISKKLRGRVELSKGSITIRLAKGGVKEFNDHIGGDPDGKDDSRSYIFEGAVESLESFLIKEEVYEGHAYILINSSTGVQNEFGERPIISPSGKTIAVYGEGKLSLPPYVEIWEIQQSTGFQQKLHEEPLDWAPRSVTWISDERWECVAVSRDSEAPIGIAILEKKPEGWTITKPAFVVKDAEGALPN